MNKFCTNCGTKLNEGDMFCANCGTAVNQNSAQNQGDVQNQVNAQQTQNNYNQQTYYNNGAQAGQQKTNGLAIAGFVCSLVGLFVFPLILGILGVCFGGVGKKRIEAFNEKGNGFATASIIIGILDIIWWIICLVIVGSAVNTFFRYF